MTKLRKIRIFILNIIIIILFLSFIDFLINNSKIRYENNLVEAYFEKDGSPKNISKDDYIGILEIPKINLKRGYYSKGDSRNNIENNITLIDYKDNKDYIFAAHSGNDTIAYFNDIHFLENGDIINLYAGNKKTTYTVYNKYLDDKNGEVSITKSNKKRLILVTCNNNDKNNYLIIEAYSK